MSQIPISMIVPAYNVEDWLDACMESIVSQTYRDFEILLINDGSTDNTEKKCLDWQKKDSRIRYFKRPHGGLSSGRNFGISQAKGDYLLFIDSDDWIEDDFVEKLYNKALQTGADIVECDFWRYNNATGEKTYRPCYGRMGIPYTTDERLLYGESVAWKCIFKKTIWSDYKMKFPDCLGASHVTYVLFLLLGVTLESIREPLYYYRRMRKGSILDSNGKGSKEEGKMGIDEMNALLSELAKRELLEKNTELIQRAIKYRMTDLLAAQYGRKQYPDFKIQRDNYFYYFQEMFPSFRNDKYVMIGGYNLNRTLSYLDAIQDPHCRFNFSSLISIANPISNSELIFHGNAYRQKMIEKDIKSLFWNVVEEIKPVFLFMDLIDDRYDVARIGEGFFTLSDAYIGADNALKDDKVICTDSEEYFLLWKKAVSVFFERILMHIDRKHIVIIENYLSEKYGNTTAQIEYEKIETIKNINELLKIKYDYIKERYPEIVWVEASKEALYFTDEEYEYGAVPEHLNEVVNKQIARHIERNIGYYD